MARLVLPSRPATRAATTSRRARLGAHDAAFRARHECAVRARADRRRDAAREHALSGLTLGDLHRLLTDAGASSCHAQRSRGSSRLLAAIPCSRSSSRAVIPQAHRTAFATPCVRASQPCPPTPWRCSPPSPRSHSQRPSSPPPVSTSRNGSRRARPRRAGTGRSARGITGPLHPSSPVTLCYSARAAEAATRYARRGARRCRHGRGAARQRHRALATEGANADVASALDAAAEHAAARGATAAAAELTVRSSWSGQQRRTRRNVIVVALRPPGCTTSRGTSLGQPRSTRTSNSRHRRPPARRRSVWTRHGRTRGSADESSPVRAGVLIKAADDDARCAELLGLIALFRWVLGDLRAGLRDARAGLVRAERGGDPRVLTVALGRVGILETWALDITPGLLERGVALKRNLPRPAWFNDSPAFDADPAALRDRPARPLALDARG